MAYVGLACAVLLLWWCWPSASLMVFLLISAWHFGDDWRTGPDGRVARGWERGVAAAAAVGAPVLFHPEPVSQLFGMLTRQAPDALAVVLLVESWTLIAIPGIIGTVWLALAHRRSTPAWTTDFASYKEA
jgi:Brp/Blh family beta-carotene 15,15'-monooxygenase